MVPCAHSFLYCRRHQVFLISPIMQHYLQKIKTRYYVILALVLSIYLFSRLYVSIPSTVPVKTNDGKVFAGSASCASCHKNIFDSHIHTAHYLDSRPASKEYIKGSFDNGKNHFVFNKETEVILEQRNHRFFQTSFINGRESQSRPFDIVVGSGRKGQTYLYWNDGDLFQLPISYYTALDSWCNSPGYPADRAIFNRQVLPYCMECHSTYAGTARHSSIDRGDFDKNQIIYGIDCERCHGPAAEHAAFHTSHPGETTGRYIVNTQRLSRQQRLDGCALCHSGARTQLRPAFSFKVGDTLDRFSLAKYTSGEAANLDVHGNQYGLLTSSKCFQQSQMDCSSCHNVHVNETNSARLFSQRCMSCHNPGASTPDATTPTAGTHMTCSITPTPGLILSDNCIDCHMPALPSQKILLAFYNESKTVHNLVRTHHIAIYPESTKEYLGKLKSHP